MKRLMWKVMFLVEKRVYIGETNGHFKHLDTFYVSKTGFAKCDTTLMFGFIFWLTMSKRIM